MSVPEVPVAASGLVRQFCEAGMLRPIDFHLARRMCQLTCEVDERVELALALTTRELRLGSVCLDVASAHLLLPESAHDDGAASPLSATLSWPDPTAWLAALAASPAVASADGPDRPFRLVDGLLYLDRFHGEERSVALALLGRSALPPRPVPPEALCTALGATAADPLDRQQQAVIAALTNATTVITGGPGTGKTTIVAHILRGLADPTAPPLVALAAPTGKAATRLETSVRDTLGTASGLRLLSSTLHKLLDIVPGRERRTFSPQNPLPHDVVVVDETSMVSLTMMAWLLEAVGDGTRLILIGDPDQLESVEAGAVLSDIADSPTLVTSQAGPAVVRLDRNWRSNKEISALAAAIRSGDAAKGLELLADGGSCTLTPLSGGESITDYPLLLDDILATAAAVRDASLAGDGAGANRSLDAHRILCAHREGPFGVGRWSAESRDWLARHLDGYGGPGPWAGQPLLITRSGDAVSNGDTGVVVLRQGRLVACIDRASGLLWRDPSVLDDVADLHAMTIHKSQGSQFDAVSVILPPVGSPLLTRQLLYTAVTRAKERVRLYGTTEAFVQAVQTPARRASGLGRR